MKIRAGFVSNSSSSSFVVVFPAGFVPTAESVAAYLFRSGPTTMGFHWDRKTPITSDELAAHVFAQMRRRKPNSAAAFARALSDWQARPPVYGAALTRAKAAFWAKEQARLGAGGRDLYVFSFSSEVDAVENELKSGRPFAGIPYLRVNEG